ncbi:winged helix-turn-helix domain-containing protein [Pseudoxanthomonas sp. UTMC 1351]|uniref:winged helix-turn-helix domain-containing protein n=1 Tax=Pseudoxanthomonas sp. UTMC 1351 TaxID=2695853 RepID=UPI0034CD9F57
MSKPTDPLAPLLSERLQVGDCVVDIPLREVRAPGSRRAVRITPKSLGVLLVLVENAGKVVSRDILLAEVWPNTLPTNDVVTQAITQLRKAFAVGRDHPNYIETIAKSGYRLLAPVEWLAAEMIEAPLRIAPAKVAEEPLARQETAPTSQLRADATVVTVPKQPPVQKQALRWKQRVLLVGGVALIAALVWAGWRWQSAEGLGSAAAIKQQLTAPTRPYQLITSAPGFEFSPTLSPDGSLVAYLSSPAEEIVGSSILVQATNQSQPRELTRPPTGAWDSNPEWSPNGREIAFLRRVPGEDCRIMAVSVAGGDERVLGDCDPGNRPSFDWTPDGSGLIFSSAARSAGSPGLRVLDLKTGRWRHLQYGATEDDVDFAPRYSPDGRWIVFIRSTPLGDLWRIPAGGGGAERLTRQYAELRGWDWTPDGRAIVYGRRVDGHTRLYWLSVANGQIRDLGIEDAQAPTIADRANALAFVQRKPHFGIYRVSTDAGDLSGPQRLFASSGRDTLPSVAPDGRQIVFTSDRSGEFALWWADMERPTSLHVIEGIRPESRYLPVWSPESRRVLVIGSDAAGNFGLYEINPANGQVVRLQVPQSAGDLLTAAYLPDPKRLLVITGSSDGGQRLTLFDRGDDKWRLLATLEGVSLAKLDPSQGRILLTYAAREGLWQTDLALSPDSLRRVDGTYPSSQRYRTWSVSEDGHIEYLEQLAGCFVSLRHIGVGRSHPAPRCVQPAHLSSVNGFSSSARNRAVYVAMAQDDGADIGFMSLPSLMELRSEEEQLADP